MTECFFDIKRAGVKLSFIFIFGLLFSFLIGDWLEINFQETTKGFLNNLSQKNIGYNSPGLGTLILINSLVGLGLVLSIYSIISYQSNETFKKYKRVPTCISWFWMLPFIFFTYSIIFSLIKLVIWNLAANNKVAALSVAHFSLGVVFLIIWFGSLALHKTKEVMKNG